MLSGFAIGASMTVPGISGGTMAMVIGIYDKLITAVSRLFSEPKKHIPFLLRFAAGAAMGAVLVARVISILLETPAGIPLRFAFFGAVAGGIPFILRKSGMKKPSAGAFALILAGLAAAMLIGLIPKGAFSPAQGTQGASLGTAAIQLLGGVLIAAALVLPGISASHMMLVLGIYESVMEKVSSLDILSLAPLAIGLAAGTFLCARLLERLMERHGKGCCLVITGFMLGSLWELLPLEADFVQWIIGTVCAAAGFIGCTAVFGSATVPD